MQPRRAGTTSLALLVPLVALASCSRNAPPRAVVLVTCDTLRADRLGYAGWPGGTSPNLDRLASESLVFESAWSTAPITGPAMSAMLTGLRPEDLGLESNKTLLSSDAVTLAERLSSLGVDTAAVVSNYVLRKRDELPDAGVQQGFDVFDDEMTSAEASRPNMLERLAPDTTDRALAWLDERGSDGSFFLWVHYQDPHGPYTPPPELVVPPEPGELGEPELALGERNDGRGTLPAYQDVGGERRPAVYRALYDGEIRFFDRELGRLLDGLRERGVLDKALVIFSADHGESLGEHGYWFSHGQNLYRELLHVPLLVRPPGGATEPARVSTPVTHLDVHPTVLAHFGLEEAHGYGTDLLAGPPPAERPLHSGLRGTWSVTSGTERLIAQPGGMSLYDLASDPYELVDLARARPERVEELERARQRLLARVAPAPLHPAEPELSRKDLEELEALGYGGGDEEDEGDDGHEH